MNFIDEAAQRILMDLGNGKYTRTIFVNTVKRCIKRALAERFLGCFAEHDLETLREKIAKIEHRRKMIDPPFWEARDNIIQGTRNGSDSVAAVVGTMFADELGQAQATLNAQFAAAAGNDIDDLISDLRTMLLIVQPDKTV